jgi:hypothetical protein
MVEFKPRTAPNKRGVVVVKRQQTLFYQEKSLGTKSIFSIFYNSRARKIKCTAAVAGRYNWCINPEMHASQK